MTQKVSNLDNIESLHKKLEILLDGRLRRRASIKKAIGVQDKISNKSGSWNGAEEVIKWREKR